MKQMIQIVIQKIKEYKDKYNNWKHNRFIKKRDKYLVNYRKFCPEPKKNSTNLPEYWLSLNKYERQLWISENLIEDSELYNE